MKRYSLKGNVKKVQAYKCIEAIVDVPTGIKRTVPDREMIEKMDKLSAKQSPCLGAMRRRGFWSANLSVQVAYG